MPVATKHTGGYALLEIMLAFSVATIILVGMVSLGIYTVRAVTVSRASAEAGRIAQREVDRLRIMRDTTAWSTFSSLSPNGALCADSEADPEVGCHLYLDAGVIKSSLNYAYEGTSPSVINYSYDAELDGSSINYTVRTWWTVGTTEKNYKIEGSLSNLEAL